MKKAFTLIELLIVIAVLAILMGMVFKLGTVGSDSYKKSKTIARMQRLENCLSGYYAAFGSYPPVKLYNSRNMELEAGYNGIQTDGSGVDLSSSDSDKVWRQVKAACLAQPVACRFPFPNEGFKSKVDAISAVQRERAGDAKNYPAFAAKGANYYKYEILDSGNYGGLNKQDTDWRDVQLFQFGLMSYLLPRYLVMMKGMRGGQRQFFDHPQWETNNDTPRNPLTDKALDWYEVADKVNNASVRSDLVIVENMPSQAVCARWIPNLANTCCTPLPSLPLFGTEVGQSGDYDGLDEDNADIEVFFKGKGGGDGNVGSQGYVLNSVTVKDGWGEDFYYYSPAPYQKYTLWSAGPNGKTFPKWLASRAVEKMAADLKKRYSDWTQDDIVHMSN